MSKTVKVLLIVAVCLVVVGSTLVGIAMLNGVFDRDRYDFAELVYEQVNYTFDADEINALFVDDVSADVHIIRSSDTSKVRVECFESQHESYDVEVLPSGTLSIVYDNDQQWFNFNWKVLTTKNTDLNIYVPADLLDSMQISTVSGQIEMIDVDCAGDIRIDNVSGFIYVRNVEIGGGLNIDTVSGDIFLQTVVCSELSAGSVSGRFQIQEVTSKGDVRFDTTSGNITFVDLKGQNIRINTVSGNVHGNLIGNVNDYTIDVDTLSGDRNVPRSEDGPLQLNVDSTSGSVDIDISE